MYQNFERALPGVKVVCCGWPSKSSGLTKQYKYRLRSAGLMHPVVVLVKMVEPFFLLGSFPQRGQRGDLLWVPNIIQGDGKEPLAGRACSRNRRMEQPRSSFELSG